MPPCCDDLVVQRVESKISDLTGYPVENGEHLQLLQYIDGEEYQLHHDYISEHRNRPAGVRVLTLLLYLTTVEEGGETEFPELGLSVRPVRGRLLMWSNVLPGGDEQDLRTRHQANVVVKGPKYVVNKWVHRRNFLKPWSEGLMG